MIWFLLAKLLISWIKLFFFWLLSLKIKDLGFLKYLPRIDFARFNAVIYLNQRKHSLDIVKNVGYLKSKPVKASNGSESWSYSWIRFSLLN